MNDDIGSKVRSLTLSVNDAQKAVTYCIEHRLPSFVKETCLMARFRLENELSIAQDYAQEMADRHNVTYDYIVGL
jgi:hypothetical protein